MRTFLTGLSTFSACNAARWYLNRKCRRDTVHCGGRVSLETVWNEGAAFGLPLPRRAVLGASAGLLGLVWLRRRNCPLGAGLVLGGGAANLYERLAHGRVYDYLRFPKAPGRLGRSVFNLADGAIFLGAAAMAAAERHPRS